MAVLFEALFPPCSSLRALRTRQLEGDAPSPGQEADVIIRARRPLSTPLHFHSMLAAQAPPGWQRKSVLSSDHGKTMPP